MSLVRICIVSMCIFFYFQDTLQVKNQRCRRTNKKPFKFCLNKQCRSNRDCGANKLCLCDGDCGLSCVRNGTHCTLPKRTRNVRVKYTDGSNFGSVANFWCSGDEYKLRGSSKRVCRGIGKWDGKQTRCRIFCKSPKEIAFGNNNGDKRSYRSGSVVRYWCFRGYPMEGKGTIQCNNRGKWNRPPPKCIAPTCSKPIIPNSAYIVTRKVKEKYKYNDMLTLRCQHGYYAVGTGLLRCEAEGWRKSNFRCIPRSCGDPGAPLNGKRIGYVFTFKRRVYFSCKKGYKLNGPEYRQCQSNQKWGDRAPTCEPIKCARLPTPQYGEKIEETSTDFGGRVVFQCKKEGYELKGSAQRICGENGKWSGIQTTCEPVECKDLGKLINGSRIPDKNKYVFEDKIHFKCNTNHTLMGNAFIICQKTKYWTGTLPRCLSPCRDPGIPIGGHRYGHSFRHNEVVRFSCNRNWKMEGTHTIRCNDGRWDHKTPKCLEGCSRPEHQNSGNMQWSSRKNLYRNGEEVAFGCYNGYKLDGDQKITCRNGKWSNVPPSCKRLCYNPGRPANGAFRGIEFFEGKQVIYFCHSTYDLFGSQTLQCLSSGRWNASRPQCKKQCQSPIIPWNGATPTPLLNRGKRTKHGAIIGFTCRRGYTLEGQPTIRCEDGRWRGGVPVCRAPCSDPGNLQNGQKYGSNFLHGNEVTYTCSGMYMLDGSSRLTCNDGRWDRSKPSCKKPCPNPGRSLPNYISQLGYDFRHGKRVDYTCQRETRLVGESSLKCNNGKWSSAVPVCREICPVLGNLLNGLIIGTKREHLSGDRVTFRCNPKYDLLPTAVALYCDKGRWNDAMPQCFGQCKVPRDFDNVKTLPAVVAQEWLHHDSVLTFSCFNKSMELDGRQRITCNNGTWSDAFPKCKVPCIVDSGHITNGFKQNSRFYARYQCNKGFTLEGNTNIACIDGKWSSGPPRCLRGCYLGSGIGNKQSAAHYNHGYQHSVQCNAGFRLDGNPTITCNNGRWSPDIPTCIGVCRDLDVPKNGERLGNNFDYGARVTFRCNDEYDVVGPSELLCNNGKWTGKEPICRARCADPGTPTNGTRIVNHFNHSTIVTFSCNEGYTMRGTQSIKCSDGQWSEEIPTCSDCGLALGMENKKIPDQNIRASTSINAYHEGKEGRLNGQWAWCSGRELQPYLEIDFGKPYRIKALATQGSTYYKKWVEAYSLESSLAGSAFHTYREDYTEKMFKGNRDSNNIIRQNLNNRLIARRIKITPMKPGGYTTSPACMRVEIYGCDLPLDCVAIGSRVVAQWQSHPLAGSVYLKAYMINKRNRRVEFENEMHRGRVQYRNFPSYRNLPFVLDVPPRQGDLQVGTRVLAPWSFRYYIGTIVTPRDRYNGYRVRADDSDVGYFTIDQIRLLKTPSFCK